MSRYVRLTKGLNDKGILIKPEEVQDHIDTDKDYYQSVYYYNDDQLKKFIETGTIKGIKDLTTDRIWFDFDSKDAPESARIDAVTLLGRLRGYGISDRNIEIAYSGNKGIHITVFTNRTLTPKQVESLAINKFGKGLETLDVSVYDNAQILRVLGTKHHKSGLYKIPLTPEQLKTLTIDQIKDIAKSLDNVHDNFEWEPTDANDEFFIAPMIEEKKRVEASPPGELDLVNKPKAWKDWKWALAQGFFDSGERNNALMVVASTSKALGYDKEQTYYLCKSALKKQAARTGQEEFDKDELWNNIIDQTVFSEGWQGGQYSPLTNVWVRKYCERMGFKIEEEKDTPTINIENAFSQFKDYAKNIDSLTIKTGIQALDKKLRMTVGMSAGLVAAPGVGKCLGIDTPVMMFDGSIKKVQDIKIGDLLMGDDSTSRTVISVCSGNEQLYKIHQENGDDYIVNESHILSLKGSANFHPKKRLTKYEYGKIHDINVLDFINGSKKQQKYLSGYKVPVEFKEKELIISPYIMGMWLGDGTSSKPEFTVANVDSEIFSSIEQESIRLNCKYVLHNYNQSGCKTVSILSTDRKNNFFFKELKQLEIVNNKRIHEIYLKNSKINRLELLAGLIDSDGHYCREKNSFTISMTNELLIDQIIYLSRSLGFRSSKYSGIKKYNSFTKNKQYSGESMVFSCYITGDNLDIIPTRLPRKKAHKQDKQRYQDLTKIEVNKLDVGLYYGFEIDGNKRFLLGDFTVTHNTSLAIQMLNNMSKLGYRSIFFSYDMYSAHVFQKLVQKHFNLHPDDIFNKFKSGDPKFEAMVRDKLKDEYSKVDFCFESGQTVSDIMDTVKKVEDSSGEKVKFVVMDYNELVLTDFADSTSSSSYVAQKMREMANVNQLCVFSLFQPNKMAGTPADEIKSYRSAKGSSAIEQSVSVMLGMSRPGFDPRKPDEDIFVSVNCLKNRMGPIFSLDLHWDGLTGSVREMEDEEREFLESIKERKAQDKQNGGDGWN